MHAFNQQKNLTVVAPSEWIANRAKSSSVLANSDIVKVNNPLSLEFITLSDRDQKSKDLSSPFLIAFVAQDLKNPFKGLNTLLECIKNYEEEFKKQNIKFVFVGKGIEVDIGSLKAQQYEKIDSTSMIDVYLKSDLLVVPSLVDNSPNVIFEALVCGIPFVGSDRAGILEISQAFKMESFKYGDPESMFRAILSQKARESDSRKIREAALALVDPRVVAKKMADLYWLKFTEAS
jgi:glycosyltransferase involved in cell wall biosynthesis